MRTVITFGEGESGYFWNVNHVLDIYLGDGYMPVTTSYKFSTSILNGHHFTYGKLQYKRNKNILNYSSHCFVIYSVTIRRYA